MENVHTVKTGELIKTDPLQQILPACCTQFQTKLSVSVSVAVIEATKRVNDNPIEAIDSG